jgi:lysophospholipase
VGQKPYGAPEYFENSAGTSLPRFTYYQKKREAETLFQLSAPSYGWLKSAMRLNHDLQQEGWKKISAPVLLFQAEQDGLVSNQEQERFIKKLQSKGTASLVKIPGSKHEIFQSQEEVLHGYWKQIFSFLEEG